MIQTGIAYPRKFSKKIQCDYWVFLVSSLHLSSRNYHLPTCYFRLWAAKCKGILQKPSKSSKSKEKKKDQSHQTSEKWGNSLTMEGSKAGFGEMARVL